MKWKWLEGFTSEYICYHHFLLSIALFIVIDLLTLRYTGEECHKAFM